MHVRSLVVFTSLVACALVSTSARADTFLTPYLGSSFSSNYGGIETPNKFVYGADLMWLGTSGVGFEIDLAYHPNFFEAGDRDELFDFGSDGNVVTLMGNLVFGYQGGGVQPYVTGGFGLMRTNIEAPLDLFEVNDNTFGVNAGGGLRLGARRFGIRGDLRYFRSLSDVSPIANIDLGNFTYWRGTVGLSLGF